MTDHEATHGHALAAGRPVVAASVSVDLVETEPDARAATRLLAKVWPRRDGNEPFPSEVAWMLAHSGNYVALARHRHEAIGAAIGFLGRDGGGLHLHSHMAGVIPPWQGASVGYALKQHQRTWALANGLDRITWTFDPLVARNAYFNVVKLGAQITRYYVDFYGHMDDDINSGDETDRCLVTWRLGSAAAEAAARGVFAPADTDEFRRAGAVDVLTSGPDGPLAARSESDVRLQQLPRDIVQLRLDDSALARAWRLALRESLVAALADGLEVLGVSRDSCYVVARPPSGNGQIG